MFPTLQTERLTLRPLTLDDAPAMFELFSDPETVRYLPPKPHQSVEQTRKGLEIRLSHEGGIDWAVILKGDDRCLGIIQYVGQTHFPQLGYIIHRDYWGQGLAVEGCRAALDYGFKELGYGRIEAWIEEHNVASVRVAEKLGMAVKGRIPTKFPHQTAHEMMLVYGVTATEWLGDAVSAVPRVFGAVPIVQVADVASTIDFYRDVLGFTIDYFYGAAPATAQVSAGEWSSNLAIIRFEQAEGVGKPSCAMYVHLDTGSPAVFAALAGQGVTVIAEPTPQPSGMVEFAIQDCNGMVLRFGTEQ